jgi:RNA polymerase sigma-70 factor, ECF subfamily
MECAFEVSSEFQPLAGVSHSSDIEGMGADAMLMLKVKSGDCLALDGLMKKHQRPIVYFLYRMVKNWDVAEELAQEVFFKIYRYRANYEATAPFNKWLYRIAMHTGLNYIRSIRHEKDHTSLDQLLPKGKQWQVPDRTMQADTRLIREVRLDAVRRAIDELPERQREVVYMHKYREMEYTQIAEALGCSTPAIKSLIFRAYSTLRLRLANLAAA